MNHRLAGALLVLALACMSGVAAAETGELRFAKQTSMGYVQFNILERQKLIEKHARALGLGEVKVSWVTFNGSDAMNTALLAGDVEVVAGGVPALVTLWAKTRGTPQEVRGISALSSQPFLLNTRNPNVRTIRDFTDASRIAVPAVGVSVQAVTLRMAAAQAFGKENYAKLDRLTIALPPPDATIGLLSGGSAFDSAFSVPPFQTQQLQDPAIHTVLNFEIEARARPGRLGDRRPAGQVDAGAGEYDEVRVVHVRRWHREGGSGDLEGPLLSRDPRRGRQLTKATGSLRRNLPYRGLWPPHSAPAASPADARAAVPALFGLAGSADPEAVDRA